MIRSTNIAGNKTSGSGVTLLKLADWSFTVLFLALLALVLAQTCAGSRVPGKPGWPEAALVLAATFSTLFSLSRQLPGQNVLLGAAIVAVLGGLAHLVATWTSIPFGPCLYTRNAGPKLFNVLPWWIPFLWVVTLLNSRGVARLILRPWRKTRNYGFRILALTTGLSVIFAFSLDPFATRVGDYWLWLPTKLPCAWYGAPLTNWLGWAVTTLLVLAFATPTLINKSPVKPPLDLHPLFVWLSLNLLFAAATAAHHLWPAMAVTGLSASVVGILAIRGARW